MGVVGLDRLGDQAIECERFIEGAQHQRLEYVADETLRRGSCTHVVWIEAVERPLVGQRQTASFRRLRIGVGKSREIGGQRRLAMHMAYVVKTLLPDRPSAWAAPAASSRNMSPEIGDTDMLDSIVRQRTLRGRSSMRRFGAPTLVALDIREADIRRRSQPDWLSRPSTAAIGSTGASAKRACRGSSSLPKRLARIS